jgi:molybdopterin/thiamine biosynthesis adenylyltransferase
MSEIARHDLDAGGGLLAPEERAQLRVLVCVEEGSAHLAAVQHTAWMTLNELVRLKGVVGSVGLRCPSDVRLAGRVVPLAPGISDLKQGLQRGCDEIGIVPVVESLDDQDDDVFDRIVRVGPGAAPESGVRVYGEGWWGGFSSGAIETQRNSSSPVGPYIAASLVVGDIFCSAALRDYRAVAQAFYSAWSLLAYEAPPDDRGPDMPALELDTLLAGVGAVGSMVVHVLWALDGISGTVVLCDADKKGVDGTNLNRYVLFGQSSLNRPKASTAAEIAAGASVTFVPVDGPVQTIESFPDRVISAVDVNTAREAIQLRYPARILSASTSDLRAEVLRVAEPGAGACLRCFNEPEQAPDDETLRAALSRGEHGAVDELARELELTAAEIEEWVASGECGRASERLLPFLRSELQLPPEFAVSFVSSFAGVLLGAELLKDMFAAEMPVHDSLPRATFTFARPAWHRNTAAAYGSQSSCPLCGESARPATVKLWRDRAAALSPRRNGGQSGDGA